MTICQLLKETAYEQLPRKLRYRLESKFNIKPKQYSRENTFWTGEISKFILTTAFCIYSYSDDLTRGLAASLCVPPTRLAIYIFKETCLNPDEYIENDPKFTEEIYNPNLGSLLLEIPYTLLVEPFIYSYDIIKKKQNHNKLTR